MNLLLAHNGFSDFIIKKPINANQHEIAAILQFTNVIKLHTGTEISVFDSTVGNVNNEIYFGNTSENNSLNISLKRDGFFIVIKNGKIYINGIGRGIIFAVNYFIENYLKIKLTHVNGRDGQYPEVTYNVPFTTEKVVIPSFIFDVQNPHFDFRWTNSQENFSQIYSDYNKLSLFYIENPKPVEYERLGESFHNLTKLFGFGTLFQTNPEFYPYIDGQRTADQINHRMPCLSQEGVFNIIKNALSAKINEKPDINIWNLSQPDGIDKYCMCELCAPKHNMTGGLSNTLFPFINKIAKEFPTKTILTLSYFVTEIPHTVETNYSDGTTLPAGKVEPNVMIAFCPTNNDKNKPISTSTDVNAVKFRSSLNAWKQSGVSLYIWEYVVNFAYYLFPFPILHVISENLKFYKEKGAKIIFFNTSSTEDSSMRGLKSYALSRLMWNPNENYEGIISDFCKAHFGLAANEMEKYYKTLHKNAINDSSGVWNSFSGTGSLIPHVNPDVSVEDTTLFSIKHLTNYYSLIEMALSKVTINSPEWRAIKIEHISLKQVEIEASTYYANRGGSYQQNFVDFFTRNVTGANLQEKFQARCNDFVSDCMSLTPPIEYINEGLRTPQNYIIDVMNGYQY